MGAQLVFPAAVPSAVKEAVDSFVAATPSPSPPALPTVFVRICRLDTVVHGNALRPDVRLAGPSGPPVSFLTVPEGVIGHSADTVLWRVGYTSAERAQLLKNDGHVAAVVFRYPDHVQSVATLDGKLAGDADKRVARATWDNVFRTFGDLAEIDQTLVFDDDDRRFVASFPIWGRKRIKGVPSYWDINAVGGSDWRYRSLLNDLLWVTPSFLGNGWTANEHDHQGVPEYLGPNTNLAGLAEKGLLAILAL
jgi:hypothetical protein